MSEHSPFERAEWKAIHREAVLVRQLIGSGASALGRAGYGNAFGEYYAAFFGLSTGIERLTKLVLIADYAIDNRGILPNQSIIRKDGHHIKTLVKKVREISSKYDMVITHLDPADPVCAAVIECLDYFADASRGRYANFEAIGNSSYKPENEPVNLWWRNVVEPVLRKYYHGTKIEALNKQLANNADQTMGANSTVMFIDESGSILSDLRSASERAGQSLIAQKYGRFYTLAIVRWIAGIFAVLARKGAYEHRIESLFGHEELFSTYIVADKLLLERKVWPLH